MNKNFYKLALVNEIILFVNEHRAKLLNELIDNSTDYTIVKRRMLMLQQLSFYESQLLKKVTDFDSDDYMDFIDGIAEAKQSIQLVVDRSA